jgi:SAM-dependent methyltransferase
LAHVRGYRVAAAGTLAAAALLIGGCGASGPGTAASQAQQASQLVRALREWSSFPVSASPRPLVLAAVAGGPSRIATAAAGADVLGIERAVRELLGAGRGICLEIGCGTGVRAAQVRSLGWTPVGADLSARMLRHARDRLPAVLADAGRLPVADGCLPAVIAVMVHTDMPGYPAVLREAVRVLRPGGLLVHVGVHPYFCAVSPTAATLPRS